jgi:hypothetical protein
MTVVSVWVGGASQVPNLIAVRSKCQLDPTAGFQGMRAHKQIDSDLIIFLKLFCDLRGEWALVPADNW